MAILNYTTKIDTATTIGEIQKILVKHGARKIVSDYDEAGLLSAVTFHLDFDGQQVYFALPCNWAGVLKALQNDPNVPNKFCNKEQALRVSWRIVKDWIEAQLAIVEAQLATMAEVFLPYAITKDGRTLYQHITENKQLLLGS